MKTKLLGIFLLGILITAACEKNGSDNSSIINPISDAIDGTWNLKASQPGFELPKDTQFAYQKTITFKTSDSSFTKTFKKGNITKTASGTFSSSIGSIADKPALLVILKYSENSDLIESCSSSMLTEAYFMREQGLLYGTWQMCDGPTLVFGR